MIKYKVNANKQCYILNIDWLHQQKVNMEIKQENKIKHSVYYGLHFTVMLLLQANIPQSETLVCSRVSQLVYLACLTNITDFTYLGEGGNLCVNCNLMSSTVGF